MYSLSCHLDVIHDMDCSADRLRPIKAGSNLSALRAAHFTRPPSRLATCNALIRCRHGGRCWKSPIAAVVTRYRWKGGAHGRDWTDTAARVHRGATDKARVNSCCRQCRNAMPPLMWITYSTPADHDFDTNLASRK